MKITTQKRVIGAGDKPKEAVKWLFSMVGSQLRKAKVDQNAFNPRSRGNVFIGGMFVYQYDPKHKETLPFYDTLPVVIPIELYNDGWLGLNLHYLPPALRRKLMAKLMEFKRRSGTPRAYMKLSYEFLTAAAQSSLFEPCIHRYLASHVRSPLLRIEDQHWETIAQLPIQQFHKAKATQVWSKKRK